MVPESLGDIRKGDMCVVLSSRATRLGAMYCVSMVKSSGQPRKVRFTILVNGDPITEVVDVVDVVWAVGVVVEVLEAMGMDTGSWIAGTEVLDNMEKDDVDTRVLVMGKEVDIVGLDVETMLK